MIALSLVRDVLACACGSGWLPSFTPDLEANRYDLRYVVLVKMMVKKLHISWVAFRVSMLACSCRLKVEDEVAVTRSGRVWKIFVWGRAT
ncbi:hypothetical protein U1Q18_040347 [Sarracenia purpurea var. burkii]